MKILIIGFILICISKETHSQNDATFLNISFSDHIQKQNDYTISIKLLNNSKSPIYISKKLLFTNSQSEFGSILFSLEKLEGACYEAIDVDMDPFGVEFDTSKRQIVKGDSIDRKSTRLN